MPIDYSQPGYKEMFANYGLTALAAQAMEKTLFILLAAVECLETRKVSKSDLYKVFDRHDRKYNVPQKLDHPISLEEGHWGERTNDDVATAA